MQLVKAQKKDYKEVFDLYKKSFPSLEKKPLWLIKKGLKSTYEIYIVRDEDKLAGFMISVRNDSRNVVMLDYLAVNPEIRSKGYGSFILKEIAKVYEGKTLFLACEKLDDEAENAEQRKKRLAFYERNGWKNTGLLTKGSSGEMYLLSFSPITREDYLETQRIACGNLLFKLGKLDATYNSSFDSFRS